MLGVLASLLFAFALLSRRLEGTVVTAPMVFVSAGLLAQWTGIVDFGAATHGITAAPLTRSYARSATAAHPDGPEHEPVVTA